MLTTDHHIALQQAADLLGERRAAEAMMAVEVLAARRPHDGATLALRARVLEAIAAIEPAVMSLELAAALSPEHPQAQLDLGHIYTERDRPSDAERCFKRALTLTGFAERRAEEARFLADPVAAIGARGMAAIREIGRRLDLDYCGVDFSVLPDGRLLIFEANATMLAHAEDPQGPFA